MGKMDKVNKIKKLREETGAGIMVCQKAMDKANGDFNKAKKIIQKELKDLVQKKKEAKTGCGYLEAYIHNNRVGVLLEVRAQTDFAIKSPVFRNLSHHLIMQIAAMSPKDVEELLKQPFIKDESKTVKDIVEEAISKLKENVKVEKFARYEL